MSASMSAAAPTARRDELGRTLPDTDPAAAVGEVAGSLAGVLVAPLAVAVGVLRTAPAPVFYLGAGALAVAGVVEWPVVALVTAGMWLAARRTGPVPTAALTSPAAGARRGGKALTPTWTATPTGPNLR